MPESSAPSPSITQTAAWRALAAHAVQPLSLAELFRTDQRRAESLTFEAGDLTIDFSKHLINQGTLSRLIDLADASGLAEQTAAT